MYVIEGSGAYKCWFRNAELADNGMAASVDGSSIVLPDATSR